MQNRIIRAESYHTCRKKLRFCNLHVQIHRIIQKQNKNHSKGGITRNDLYDKICMTLVSSVSSHLYEGILKPNKSHTNGIMQIGPCTIALRPPID